MSPACATCGSPIGAVFYQSPARQECTPCYDRRTGLKKLPPEKKTEREMRDLKADAEEMVQVAEWAKQIPLDTPEDVAQFEALLEELRGRKAPIIDALNAFETAEDAILDALDNARRRMK